MAKVPANLKKKIKNLIANGSFANETISKIKQASAARKIEFEIGDKKRSDFKPQFKTKHWDNECNFSARLVMNEGGVVEHDGKIGFEDDEKISRFYEKYTGDEDGGFEFDVVLKQRPANNVLVWTLQYKNLDFFFQPPL